MFFLYGNIDHHPNPDKRADISERRRRLENMGFRRLANPINWWMCARMYGTQPQPTYHTIPNIVETLNYHGGAAMLENNYLNIYRGFFENEVCTPLLVADIRSFLPIHIDYTRRNRDIFDIIGEYYAQLIQINRASVNLFYQRYRSTTSTQIIQYGGKLSKTNLANEYIIDPFTHEYIYIHDKRGKNILKEYIKNYYITKQ